MSAQELCQLSLTRVGLELLLQLPSEEEGGWRIPAVVLGSGQCKSQDLATAPSTQNPAEGCRSLYRRDPVTSDNGGQFLAAHGSVSRGDLVLWLQMRGLELYRIRRKWQGIAVDDSLLCRMEALT